MKHKNNHTRLQETVDAGISRLVRSLEYEIPPALEDRLDRAIMSNGKAKKTSRRWSFALYPAAAMLAAAILVGAFFVFRPFTGGVEPAPIAEIRTEFEIKDKNIKIIWFQKKDFELRRKKS